MVVPALNSLPWNVPPGTAFISGDQKIYIFDRVDPDGVVVMRARKNGASSDFTIVSDDGLPRRPFLQEFLTLLADGTLEWVAGAPDQPLAQRRRLNEYDAEQARILDAQCDFRIHMVRALDDAVAQDRQSLSDRKLSLFIDKCLRDPKIGDLPGAWKCSPSTLREWNRNRGRFGSRRVSDGICLTGRSPKARKVNHPIEILTYYVTKAATKLAPISQTITAYRAELADINQGRDLHRCLAAINELGAWEMAGEQASYPKPDIPYTPISKDAFYSLVRAVRSKKAYALETTAQGARQRYEGGGVTEMPTRIGMLGQIDDTPVPNLFLIDDRTGIPLGQATLTVLIDTVSRLVIGWDLSWDKASTGTVLRTIIHSNRPKAFPHQITTMLTQENSVSAAALAQQSLTWGYKCTRIRGDNLSGYHSREVEDALLDAGISHEFTAKHKPRAKPHVERILKTLQDLLFKRLPDAKPDADLALRFGHDPAREVLCTLEKARELLDLACVIYNFTRHTGLDGKQPSLVHQEHLARYKVTAIEDESILRRALARGEKEIEITNTGVRLFARRYSSAQTTAKIIEDHERAARKRCRNAAPEQARQTRSHRRQLSFKVRIKYDEDDLGQIHVWNPHADPQGKWETLECTSPDMKGRPKWLHDRILELHKSSADGHLEKSIEDKLHALLQREIMNVTPESSDRELRDHAKAMASPYIASALQNWIEVSSEDVQIARSDMAAGHSRMFNERRELSRHNAFHPSDIDASPRKDALKISPRPRRAPSSTIVASSRERGVPLRATTSKHQSQPSPRRRQPTPRWSDIA